MTEIFSHLFGVALPNILILLYELIGLRFFGLPTFLDWSACLSYMGLVLMLIRIIQCIFFFWLYITEHWLD